MSYPARAEAVGKYDYYYLLIRDFHINVSWRSFTGDCVTASILKSPGLFSVFWLFSIMRLFGWSPFGCQLPNPPESLIILLLPCQKHQSQLVLLSPSCSTVFRFSSKVEVLISLFTFFQIYSVVSRDSKVDNFADFLSFFFFLLFIIFNNPSARAGYDTKSIFKRSLTGLNSEFSFS